MFEVVRSCVKLVDYTVIKFSYERTTFLYSGGSRGGAWGARPPLILAKKSNEEMQMEEKPTGQAIFANQITKNPAPRPLVQALDPPLL